MLTLVMSSNFINVNQTNRCKHNECHKQYHRVLPCFKGILSGNRNYLIEKYGWKFVDHGLFPTLIKILFMLLPLLECNSE